MATEKDITDKRDEDVMLLNNKIRDVITIQNDHLAIDDPQQLDLDETITALMRSRTDMRIQQLMAGLHSAQLTAALAKITAASGDLKQEADKMKTATTFISNTNAVVGAATKVTNILKNGG